MIILLLKPMVSCSSPSFSCFCNQVGGWSQVYKGLSFVTVTGAGHEVPLHRPRQAFILFRSFLENKNMSGQSFQSSIHQPPITKQVIDDRIIHIQGPENDRIREAFLSSAPPFSLQGSIYIFEAVAHSCGRNYSLQ